MKRVRTGALKSSVQDPHVSALRILERVVGSQGAQTFASTRTSWHISKYSHCFM